MPAATPPVADVPALSDVNSILRTDDAVIAVVSHPPLPPLPSLPYATSTVAASQWIAIENRATTRNPSPPSLLCLPVAASTVIKTSGIDNPTTMTNVISAAVRLGVVRSVKGRRHSPLFCCWMAVKNNSNDNTLPMLAIELGIFIHIQIITTPLSLIIMVQGLDSRKPGTNRLI